MQLVTDGIRILCTKVQELMLKTDVTNKSDLSGSSALTWENRLIDLHVRLGSWEIQNQTGKSTFSSAF